MATALRRIGRIELTNAADSSHRSLEFSVFPAEGGSYCWLLISPDGSVLARSRRFTSQADAEQAAQYVIDNAHSARLLPASDGDRQVVFTHPGSIDSEAGLA